MTFLALHHDLIRHSVFGFSILPPHATMTASTCYNETRTSSSTPPSHPEPQAPGHASLPVPYRTIIAGVYAPMSPGAGVATRPRQPWRVHAYLSQRRVGVHLPDVRLLATPTRVIRSVSTRARECGFFDHSSAPTSVGCVMAPRSPAPACCGRDPSG